MLFINAKNFLNIMSIFLNNILAYLHYGSTLILTLSNNTNKLNIYFVAFMSYIYRERYIKCYRAIALKLLIISENVSDKSFSVREGRYTGPSYFLIGGGAEATSRSTPLF